MAVASMVARQHEVTTAAELSRFLEHVVNPRLAARGLSLEITTADAQMGLAFGPLGVLVAASLASRRRGGRLGSGFMLRINMPVAPIQSMQQQAMTYQAQYQNAFHGQASAAIYQAPNLPPSQQQPYYNQQSLVAPWPALPSTDARVGAGSGYGAIAPPPYPPPGPYGTSTMNPVAPLQGGLAYPPSPWSGDAKDGKVAASTPPAMAQQIQQQQIQQQQLPMQYQQQQQQQQQQQERWYAPREGTDDPT